MLIKRPLGLAGYSQREPSDDFVVLEEMFSDIIEHQLLSVSLGFISPEHMFSWGHCMVAWSLFVNSLHAFGEVTCNVTKILFNFDVVYI